MSLCYHCGKEEETEKCPHCGISYCTEHLPAEKHSCMVYARKHKPKGKPRAKETVVVEERAPEQGSRPSNRVLIAFAMIMISLSSSYMVSVSSGGAMGLAAVTPSETDYGLHSVALGQVNTYRYRNDLADIEYRVDPVAQEWAVKLARDGSLRHNPDLPVSRGENVARRCVRGEDPKVALAFMVQEMVTKDKQFGYANRDNILGDFDYLSIGVAVDGDTVVLVLNFY